MTAEVQRLGKWLKELDVGIALDPEWDVGPGQIPGFTYGNTDGTEINTIAAHLDGIVAKNDLPQKVLVYHQVANGVVTNADAIKAHSGVAVVQSVDGIGSPGSKTETYNAVMAGKPATVHPGFKLFFEEDAALGPLMTPAEVLALKPQPEYVLYE
ncbi:hypothetical protein JOE65_000122 [Arthrobacter roseus]|nr:hypothetical protein [Arthrobacter roseus]